MTLVLNAHGLLGSETVSEGVRASYGGLLDLQVSSLGEILDDASKERPKVDRDPGLNLQGKSDRLRTLARKTSKKISDLGKSRRQKLDSDLDKATRELPVGPVTASDVVDFHAAPFVQHERALLLDRVRGDLLNLDPAEVKPILSQAAQAGDAVTLFALASLPKWRQESLGIFPDDFQSLHGTYWATAQPGKFTEVDTIRTGIRHFESNLAQAHTAAAEILGVPSYSPEAAELERTAGGA